MFGLWWGEFLRALGLGFTNPGGTWGKWDMCVCFVFSGVGEEWVGGFGQGLVEWRVVMSVCVVSLDYLCGWQVQVSEYIPAYLRCTQCLILLHRIDICFLTCICLWQISQIQTCLCVVVGPGLVSTLSDFMRIIARNQAGPHGRFAKNTVIGPPLLGTEGVDSICSRFARPL